MAKRRIFIRISTLLLLMFLVNVCILPETWGTTKAGPESRSAVFVDPLADRILKEMGDFLKNAKARSFHAEISYDDPVPPSGKIQYGASADFVYKNPNKLYAEYLGDRGGRRFWCDGETITILDVFHDTYGEIPIPQEPQVGAILDRLMNRYGWSIPLSEFFTADPYKTLLKEVKEGYYIGLHRVEDVRCHHLLFISDRIDWQIWIEDGPQPVPRKVTITYKTLSSSPQFTAVLSQWEINTPLSEGLFSAIIPRTAEKIDFLKAIPEGIQKPRQKEE